MIYTRPNKKLYDEAIIVFKDIYLQISHPGFFYSYWRALA